LRAFTDLPCSEGEGGVNAYGEERLEKILDQENRGGGELWGEGTGILFERNLRLRYVSLTAIKLSTKIIKREKEGSLAIRQTIVVLFPKTPGGRSSYPIPRFFRGQAKSLFFVKHKGRGFRAGSSKTGRNSGKVTDPARGARHIA